ncbi:MAG: glucan biosynthesis protein [Verrucomicrobiae bacterium]|nr:glucan biosynthesis protein [Verrucomicrobiae bacterium]
MSLEKLKAIVHQTAQSDFVPPPEVGSKWTQLSYVDYSKIQFRPNQALWSGTERPFQIAFMHPGYVHRHTVEMSEISAETENALSYSTNLFDYGPETTRAGAGYPSGFAGFKIVSTVNGVQEMGSFIGASYFRFLGSNQVYGLSARGLALDVLHDEEFPLFRRFWLQRPDRDAAELLLFALLDSPSIVGGFEFRITPGATAVTRVQAYFKPRGGIREPGIAPLTSMFLHDDNGRDLHHDFRPEVHDSDGLLLHTGSGQWIWRPLDKGRMLRVNAYADDGPRGFGLMQRDRDFTHYEDPIASFERRPSAWVEPLGSWGKGAVVLVQLPSDREFSDNVVAYWRPERPADSTQPWHYAYAIHWTTNRVVPGNLASVVSSRVGVVVVEPPKPQPNLRFVIDFGGGKLDEKSQPRAVVDIGPGATKVAESLYFVRETGLWRLVIEITQPELLLAMDLNAVLHLDHKISSERWTFTWQP